MTVVITSGVNAWASGGDGSGLTVNAPNQGTAAALGSFFTAADEILIGTGFSTFTSALLTDILDGSFSIGYDYNDLKLPTADLDVNTNKIINLVDPTSNQDAATKFYVDTAGGGPFLPLAGGNMTGDICLDFNKLKLDLDGNSFLESIVDDVVDLWIGGVKVLTVDAGQLNNRSRTIANVLDPVSAQQAATKNYVDTEIVALSLNGTGPYLRLSGVDTMVGALDMGTNLINNVVDPVAAQDAATMNYVDTEIIALALNGTGPYLRLSGADTMTGALDMGTNLINNVVDPVAAQDAATMSYVDTSIAALGTAPFLSLSGGTMTGTISFGAPGLQILADPAAGPPLPTYSFTVDPGTGMTQAGPPGFLDFISGGATNWTMAPAPGALLPGTPLAQDIGASGVEIADIFADHLLMEFGAAGDPPFSFDGDPDTGMFWVAGDTLGFSLGGFTTATWSTTELDFTAADGSGAGTGGIIDVNAGKGGATGGGGSIDLTGGDGGSTSGDGGDINLTGGSADGGGSGGSISMTAGTGASPGGDIILTAGNSTGTDIGGSLTLTAGTGGTGAGGDGGPIAISAGNAGVGSAGDGADITLTPGTEDGGGAEGQVIIGKLGTAVAPVIVNSSDPDTGIFWNGSNELLFAGAGIERLRIEGNGTLSVAGTAAYETLVTSDDDIPNKKFVDDSIVALGTGPFLPLAGGTLTGTLITSAGIQIQADGGSAASPAYSFSGDTDAGMWSDGTNLRFAVAGSDELLVTSSEVSAQSKRVTNVASPTTGTDAVNRDFIDAQTHVRLLNQDLDDSPVTIDLTSTGITTIYSPDTSDKHIVMHIILRAVTYTPGGAPTNPVVDIGLASGTGDEFVSGATLDWGGTAGAADQAVYLLPVDGSPTPNSAETVRINVTTAAGGTFSALTAEVYIIGIEL